MMCGKEQISSNTLLNTHSFYMNSITPYWFVFYLTKKELGIPWIS